MVFGFAGMPGRTLVDDEDSDGDDADDDDGGVDKEMSRGA
jgi:hypothetical protein